MHVTNSVFAAPCLIELYRRQPAWVLQCAVWSTRFELQHGQQCHISRHLAISDLFVQRRVCGSVHHRESKCGYQQAGARGQAR